MAGTSQSYQTHILQLLRPDRDLAADSILGILDRVGDGIVPQDLGVL
jgi:hypothetical protein